MPHTSEPPVSSRRRDDPRRHHPVAITATAIALLILGLIAARPDVSPAERSVFAAFNQLGPAWSVVLFPVMQLGTLFAGPSAALGAAITGRRLLAGELLVAGLGGWFASRLAKIIVGRPRPSFFVPETIIRGGEASGLGYPSGHVTVATAIVTVLAAWLPRRWEAPLWVLVILVGIGRMYVGAHLPLDVVGGVVLGGLIGAGVRTLSHFAFFRHLAFADDERQPAPDPPI